MMGHSEGGYGFSRCSRGFWSVSGTPPSCVRSLQSPIQPLIEPYCREDNPTKDQQKEHSSANLVEVLSWILECCGLPHAPAAIKMCGFCAAQDSDD